MRYRPSFVFHRALEAARTALQRLDADQVPASLRPVVRASSLHPGVELPLMRGLEEFEWLRDKAVEEWAEARTIAEQSEGPDVASALFLVRPEGWAAALTRFVWESGNEAASGSADARAKEAAALERAREADRARLRTALRELEETKQRVREAERQAAAPRRSAGRAEQRAADAASRLEEEMARRDQVHQERIEGLESEVERLQETLRSVREERANLQASLDAERGGSSFARTGRDLARGLDALAAAAERAIGEPAADVGAGPPLALPPGVRPDSAAALEVVLAHSGPVHLVVDGYNAGLVLAEGDAAEVRSRLDPVLSRLRTLARPPRTVTVVYDSSIAASSQRRSAGVAVRFAPASVPADDVIVDLAANPGTVVISNDRELRERCGRLGALALWSDALVEWARKRS